jgi:hypothetical protein
MESVTGVAAGMETGATETSFVAPSGCGAADVLDAELARSQASAASRRRGKRRICK